MLLAARSRREASHVGRQDTHRHRSDGGRKNRPKRGQLLDRAGVGQVGVTTKPRRRADRRSRSTGEIGDTLQQLNGRRTAGRKNRERRIWRRTERLRIVEERRVKETLGTHERRVRQRPETGQVKGTDRRLAGVPAQDSRGRAERARTPSADSGGARGGDGGAEGERGRFRTIVGARASYVRTRCRNWR